MFQKTRSLSKFGKRWEFQKDHIHFYGLIKTGGVALETPDKMPAGEIGGPDSEIFYEFEELITILSLGNSVIRIVIVESFWKSATPFLCSIRKRERRNFK